MLPCPIGFIARANSYNLNIIDHRWVGLGRENLHETIMLNLGSRKFNLEQTKIGSRLKKIVITVRSKSAPNAANLNSTLIHIVEEEILNS